MSDEEKISPAAISTAARNTKREAAFSQESENRTQTTTGAKPTRRQPQQVHNPGKIIVGKANLKRDIPIFLGVFGFLAMLAYMSGDVGKVDDSKGKKMSIRDLQELLMKNLEETRARELARKRTIECDLFLATSSIPGAGLGIFAGKHFQEGDEVIHPGLFFPVFNGKHSSVDTHVSQNGLLLKHHPFLSNLQGAPTWSNTSDFNCSNINSLKATRTIEPGDELFLPFHDHPQRVLGERSDLFNVPSLEEYGKADEIVQHEIKVLKPHLTLTALSAGRGVVRTKPTDTGDALKLAKSAIEIVNKRVAALLPKSMKQLERRELLASSTAFSALTNLTVSHLELNGQCLDDVQVKQSVVRSMQKGLFAQRPIKKGNLVVPAPLYAVRHERTCSSDDVCATGDAAYVKHCFGHRDSSLLLCPLSAASFIQTTFGDKASPTKGNAVVQWSSRVNVKRIHKLTVDEVLENYALSLGMDIVALRDIEPGEEIIIDGGREGGTEHGSIQVGETIYSNMWKFS